MANLATRTGQALQSVYDAAEHLRSLEMLGQMTAHLRDFESQQRTACRHLTVEAFVNSRDEYVLELHDSRTSYYNQVTTEDSVAAGMAWERVVERVEELPDWDSAVLTEPVKADNFFVRDFDLNREVAEALNTLRGVLESDTAATELSRS